MKELASSPESSVPLDQWFLAELARRLQTTTRGISWKPTPKQAEAIESEADELFYGGAAGGGKTDLVVALPILEHSKAFVFRWEKEQLKDAIERSTEIVGDAGRYSSQAKVWRLSGGRMLYFGGVQSDRNIQRWQGRAGDYKGFDELPHFTEYSYLFLSGWNRTTVKGQRCRTVAVGNPPVDDPDFNPDGRGLWILKRWGAWLDPDYPKPAKPGELRFYIRVRNKDTEVQNPRFYILDAEGRRINLNDVLPGDKIEGDPTRYPRIRLGDRWVKCEVEEIEVDGQFYVPRSRTFIPAVLQDNPYLGRDYEAVLDQMPEPLRTQLKEGVFVTQRRDNPFAVFPASWVDAAVKRWREKDRAERGRLDCVASDIARGGLSDTVIAKRYGNWIDKLKKTPGVLTPDGPSAATLIANEHEGDATIHVDVGGIGGSVYDSLRTIENPATQAAVIPINFAEGSKFRDRSGRLGMANKRAAMHWALREALDPSHGDEIALPDDEDLIADMKAIRWKLTVRGVQIEDKDKIKKRTGRGCHCSDAVIMACWIGDFGGFSEGDAADFWDRKPKPPGDDEDLGRYGFITGGR